MPMNSQEVRRRAEVLAVALANRAEAAEQARRLPDETIDDVTGLDLFRLVVPTSMGGHGLGVADLAQLTRVLGTACPASAWTISFLIMHSWLLGKFPAAGRAELFPSERPWALAPAPLAPTGTARPAEGGYLVSGRWEWATGVHHADWVMVHAVQTEPAFASFFAVVPRSEATVEDVWYTSGMCATGSDTVALDNVFVPAHRTIPSQQLLFPTDRLDGDGMADLPVPPVLALVAAAPALGAAERAVDLYRERIAERVLAYSMGDRAIDQPAARMRLGAAVSDLAAARLRWDAAVAQLAACTGGGEVPVPQRMAWRLTAAATVRAARAVISTIAEGAGASVYFTASPFQRLQRDVEVLKGHVIFDWDRTTELAGRVELGMELQPTDMV